MRERKEVVEDIAKLKQEIDDLENECPVLVYVDVTKNDKMGLVGRVKEERGHKLKFGMSNSLEHFAIFPLNATKDMLIDRLEQMIITLKGEEDA